MFPNPEVVEEVESHDGATVETGTHDVGKIGGGVSVSLLFCTTSHI